MKLPACCLGGARHPFEYAVGGGDENLASVDAVSLEGMAKNGQREDIGVCVHR